MHDLNNRIELSLIESFLEASKFDVVTFENMIRANENIKRLMINVDTFFEIFELKNLLNIDDSLIVKSKNKFRKSQNKKFTLRAKKTTTQFTKRDFSKFELVKRNIEIKAKRVKKEARNRKSERGRKGRKNRKNEKNEKSRKSRKNRKNRKNEKNIITQNRKVATSKITRSTTTIFQIIDIFNDEINDNEFNYFENNDNDDKFRESMNENEVFDDE